MRRKNKGVNITFSLYPARRRPMLAPPRRQHLIPPPGHANRAPRIPPAAGPCWRRPADNPLSHRWATPTGRPEFRPAPAHVGATPPTTPYPTAGPRQQGVLFSRRVPSSRRASPSSPKGPLVPAGLPLFPEGPPRPGGPAPLHGGPAPLLPKGPLFPAGLPLFPRRAPTGGQFCRHIQIEI